VVAAAPCTSRAVAFASPSGLAPVVSENDDGLDLARSEPSSF
jgi:hypothetical protein